MNIEMIRIHSSAIDFIGYDKKTKTVAVQFKPKRGKTVGDVYHVSPVKPEVYYEFSHDRSPGNFYNEIFKDSPYYDVHKVVQTASTSPARGFLVEIDCLEAAPKLTLTIPAGNNRKVAEQLAESIMATTRTQHTDCRQTREGASFGLRGRYTGRLLATAKVVQG